VNPIDLRLQERKTLERRETTLVQQISATQRQVFLKSRELVQELQAARQPQQNFLLLALADKVNFSAESGC
jgi:serine phosphatase RsbU (regulator of sigma subunit)